MTDATDEPLQKTINRLLRQEFGEEVTFAQLDEFKLKHGYMPFYIRKDKQYRKPGTRGVYLIPPEDAPLSDHGPGGAGATVLHKERPEAAMLHVDVDDEDDETPEDETRRAVEHPTLAFRHDKNLNASEIETRLHKLAKEASMLSVVPEKMKSFVPFGKFDRIKRIIEVEEFLPVFITGPTGNGKTTFPEQACALLGREYVNIDITAETDEDDLIGGFRLRNGETYFELGPALVAAIRGAVLVLNELDLASPKIMCLQRLLEGKPLTVKKLGVVIKPAKGFTVYATANTKGRGDESGRYIGTGLLNEAFLRRFKIYYEQEYPPIAVEKKILIKTFESFGGTMNAQTLQFFDTLAKWAESIRKSYAQQAVEEQISTRELCSIVHVFKVFGANREAQEISLDDCTNHFDAKTKDAFIDLYNKLAPDAAAPTNVGSLGKTPF